MSEMREKVKKLLADCSRIQEEEQEAARESLRLLGEEADKHTGEARAALYGPERRTPEGFRLGWEVSAVYSLWAIDDRLAQIAALLERADQ